MKALALGDELSHRRVQGGAEKFQASHHPLVSVDQHPGTSLLMST